MATLFAAFKFIGILLEVVLIFNLLIIVHELGHFLAAKWRGLYIEGFGIWFGKPIWKKKINGVTYSLGCIPAGGFVKLPQLAPMEALEGQTEIPKDQLKPISALDKIIVAFAGPLFSFMLAAVFAVIVWQIGKPMGEQESTRVVGMLEKDSPAEKAGLLPGDEILEVDGQPVERFMGMNRDSIMWNIVRSEGATIKLHIRRGAEMKDIEITPRIPGTKAWERSGTRQIGYRPALTPLVAKVEPGSAMAKAGVQKNDFITAINGQPLYSPLGISDYIRDHPGAEYKLTVERGAAKEIKELPFQPAGAVAANVQPDSPAEKAGLKKDDRVISVGGQKLLSSSAVVRFIEQHNTGPIAFVVERAGAEQKLTITPALTSDVNDAAITKPKIGVGFDDHDGLTLDGYGRGQVRYPTPGEQLSTSAMSIFNTVAAISSRKSDVKLQHMGGPITMMRIYYQLFGQENGWKLALWFSVLINVNLAMLNMLPIPVLDGGHITLALIEAVRRKPVNVRVLEWVQTAAALLVIGFMLYITFFDAQDLFGGKGNKFRPAAPPAQQK